MKPRPKSRRAACVLCAATRNIERNHIGGRNHVIWVTAPFCRSHHRRFHFLLEAAGVDLEYTPDPVERLIRATNAINIFQCMLHEAMREAYSSKVKS